MSVHAVHEYVADPVTCSLMKSNSEFMAFHMKQVKYGMFVVQNLNYCYWACVISPRPSWYFRHYMKNLKMEMNKMKNKMKAKMKLMKKTPRNNKIKEDRMSALATAHVLY